MTTRGRLGWLALIALVAGCNGHQCDLRAGLLARAGNNAMDCGQVLVGGDASSVDACVVRAFGGQMSFIATYGRQGIDSQVVSGLAGDNQGRVFFLLWDSAPCGGAGCNPVITEDICEGPSPNTSPTRDASQTPPITCTGLTSRGLTCG